MALDTRLQDILKSHRDEIASTVQLTYLLPVLHKRRLMTQAEFQELGNERVTEYARGISLVTIVQQKGKDAYDIFVEALKEERQHLGHVTLANTLAEKQKELAMAVSKPTPPPRHRTAPATSCRPAVEAPQSPALSKRPLDDDPKFTITVREDPPGQLMSLQAIQTITEKLDKMESRLNGKLNKMESRLNSVETTVKQVVEKSNAVLEEKIGLAMESMNNQIENLATIMQSQVAATYDVQSAGPHRHAYTSTTAAYNCYVEETTNPSLNTQPYDTVTYDYPLSSSSVIAQASSSIKEGDDSGYIIPENHETEKQQKDKQKAKFAAMHEQLKDLKPKTVPELARKLLAENLDGK